MEIISRKEALALGLTKFFTGEPCQHGHIAERDVKRYVCCECNRVRASSYYADNKDYVLARNAEKKEERQAYNAAYQAINKEALLTKRREYNIKNKDKLTKKQREYREKNKEKIAAYKAAYKKENASTVNADNKRRKTAQMQRTPAWLTEDDLWMMREIYELATLRTKLTGIPWEVDHIIPLRGKKVSGLHVPNNLQVITANANHRKLNKWNPDHGQ